MKPRFWIPWANYPLGSQSISYTSSQKGHSKLLSTGDDPVVGYARHILQLANAEIDILPSRTGDKSTSPLQSLGLALNRFYMIPTISASMIPWTCSSQLFLALRYMLSSDDDWMPIINLSPEETKEYLHSYWFLLRLHFSKVLDRLR